MAFALAGSVITQSGTDTSLAGLNGISGVTVQSIVGTVYPLTIYTLTGRQLKVTGTLTQGSREKLILTGQGAADYILDVDGGTFNVGEAYTLNSFTTQLPIEAVVWALTSGGSWNTRVWCVRNAGKMIARNALFRIPHSIWFEQNGSGQVLLENCVIDKSGSTGDIQTNHGNTVANNTVIRNTTIFCDGQSGLTFRNQNKPTIENVAVYQARDAWNNESSAVQIVRGLVPNTGSLVDIAQTGASTTLTLAVNAQRGVQFLWGGHLANDTLGNRGEVGVYQELNATVNTPAGTAVQGAIFYLTDTPVAADSTQTALPTPSGGTVNTAQRQVYIAATDAAGIITQQTVLIGSGKRTTGGAQFIGGNSNRVRPRGRNTTASFDATDDIYDYTIWSYAHLTQTNPVILKAGSGGSALSVAPSVLPDTNVTITQAQAAALASIATLDNLYDAAKNWKCQAAQANLEYPTIGTQPVTGSGAVLDLGNINLVVDASAATAFAINTATKTITIKSTALAVGAKFTSLKTTGTVTLISGAVIAATYTDANSAGEIRVQLTSLTDTVQMRRASDNSLISSRTGAGGFAVAPALVGVSVYFERRSGANLVMSTISTPVTLTAGVNTAVPLYAGAEVQVAQAGRIALLPTLTDLERAGGKLDKALKAAQAAEDQTV